MENEYGQGQDSVYSNKVRAGKRRTYFFDVKQTRGDDYYITLTESTRKFNGNGFTRHKIFLYKEDFNRFLKGLQDAVNHVKTDLMPEYDYEQFDRRQEEWEKQKALEAAEESSTEAATSGNTEETLPSETTEETLPSEATESPTEKPVDNEDDMTW